MRNKIKKTGMFLWEKRGEFLGRSAPKTNKQQLPKIHKTPGFVLALPCEPGARENFQECVRRWLRLPLENQNILGKLQGIKAGFAPSRSWVIFGWEFQFFLEGEGRRREGEKGREGLALPTCQGRKNPQGSEPNICLKSK